MKTAILIGIFIAVAHAAPSPKIKTYVRVSDAGPITLSHIINWKLVDDKLKDRLSKIVLGDGPQLGEQRIYTSRAIAKVVRSNVPELNGVKIPSRITVENRGYELNQDAVAALLKKRWGKLCSDCKFIFKSVSIPILPKEAIGKSWNIESQGRLPRGTFTRKVEIQLDSGSPVVYWMSGQVEIHRKVPVVNKAIEIGHRFTSKDITYKMRDVTFATDGVPKVNEIIGQQSKRGLRANDVVWYGYITRERALRRGETVRVTTGEGLWQLSLMAIAEQDGFIGDTIRVKNRSTKQTLSGLIVGKGEVVIK